jgi:hypothetical protein
MKSADSPAATLRSKWSGTLLARLTTAGGGRRFEGAPAGPNPRTPDMWFPWPWQASIGMTARLHLDVGSSHRAGFTTASGQKLKAFQTHPRRVLIGCNARSGSALRSQIRVTSPAYLDVCASPGATPSQAHRCWPLMVGRRELETHSEQPGSGRPRAARSRRARSVRPNAS